MIPIYLVLSGKLNKPVPIALASSANIDPRSEPSCMGPKYLEIKFRFFSSSVSMRGTEGSTVSPDVMTETLFY